MTAGRREPLRQPDGRRLPSQGRGVGYPSSCLLTCRTNKAGGKNEGFDEEVSSDNSPQKSEKSIDFLEIYGIMS